MGAAKSEFDIYGDSYHEAGRVLAQRLAAANGYSDADACPIVYLYRHALELYLKALLIAGGKYLVITRKGRLDLDWMLKGKEAHRLTAFLGPLRQVFIALDWPWDAKLDDLLKGLEAVDPFSYAFRYPVKTDGSSALPAHFGFNVLEFCNQLDPVLEELSGAVMGIEHYCDVEAEIAAEYRDMEP